MLNNELRTGRKRGFTLIELLVTMAIVLIVTLVAVPTVTGYVRSAKLIRYNDSAKTIYLAMQNYLTDAKVDGRLQALNTYVQNQPDRLVSADKLTNPVKPPTEDIYYLTLSKNGGARDQELYDILSQYVYDTSILAQSMVVEYSIGAAKVFSVSYTEDADGFYYGASPLAGQVSNSDRSIPVREELMFGYYASDAIDLPNPNDPLEDIKLELVNKEQLYLEWTSAQPKDAAFEDETIRYRAVIKKAGDAEGKEYMSITVPVKQIKTFNAALPISHYLLELETKYWDEGSATYKTEQREHWVYSLVNGSTVTYRLILDNIDVSDEAYSISKRYSFIPMAPVLAEMSATSDKYRPSKIATSNTEHSYYTHNALGASGSNGIGNARHLNNVRYAPADTDFVQLVDVDWADTVKKGHVIVDGKVYTTVDAKTNFGMFEYGGAARAGEMNGGKYLGTYDGGSHSISNLTLDGDPTHCGGLFSANGGEIKDLKLLNATVDFSNVAGNSYPNIGGVTGYNTGALKNVTFSGTVKGLDNVGGIVGQNAGKLEGTIQVAAPAGGGRSSIDGREDVGGIMGLNAVAVQQTLRNLSNAADVKGAARVGGIVGANGEKATLESCKNTGYVAGAAKSGVEQVQDIGGITGKNQGKVLKCTNELAGMDKPGSFAQGAGINVGGIAGSNEGGEIEECTVKSIISGGSHVGGVVGYNKDGSVKKSNTTGGSVTGADDGEHIGGIIGKNESDGELAGFTNKASVLGGSYVGGIVGTNGTGEKAGSKISGCTNNGMVGAKVRYGGGITGFNTGVISSCASDMGDVKMDELAKYSTGDYIGGITGYNNGQVEGASGTFSISSSKVAGRNYVGGVIGHNDVKGQVRYFKASGVQVKATGDFAGGFFGLNTSSPDNIGAGQYIELICAPELVEGRYFVGGVMGANIVTGSGAGAGLTLKVESGSASSETGGQKGTVKAEAFAGGVLGYNDIVAAGSLESTLAGLQNINAYSDDLIKTETPSGTVTKIMGSANRASVSANRFVGGIVGLNSASSTLEIDGCYNYGDLAINSGASGAYTGDYFYIGGITGYNSSAGSIKASHNTGRITSLSKYTGGLVEVNDGEISDCTNTGSINGKSNVGGIAGLNGQDNKDAKIVSCTVRDSSSMTGTENMGGIAGTNDALVEGCNAHARITGTGDNIGGIVGVNTSVGVLTDNTVTGGSVKGRNNVGGFIGKNESTAEIKGLVNKATVTATGDYAGGIVGWNKGTRISFCVNRGSVTTNASVGVHVGGIAGANEAGSTIQGSVNNGSVTSGGQYAGGIVAENRGALINCYAGKSGVVSGARNAGGLVGLNDTNGTITYDDTPIDLPKDEPAQDLRKDGYILAQSNVTSKCAGGNSYVGGFIAVNQGKVTIPGSTVTTATGTNVVINNIAFTGDVQYTNAKAYGTAGVTQYAGGIVGWNQENTTIENCRFDGKISKGGNGGTGAVAGLNDGKIANIALGNSTITSMGITGGITGVNQKGFIEECANTDKTQITGQGAVGGFVGLVPADAAQTLYANFENYAQVATTKANAGGIIGKASTSSLTVTGCANYGKVLGSQTQTAFFNNDTDAGAGGIVASLAAAPVTSGSVQVTDCHNYGLVNSRVQSRAGGVVGTVSSTAGGQHPVVIQGCTNGSKGEVTSSAAGHTVGGVVGLARDNVTIDSCANGSGGLVWSENNLGGPDYNTTSRVGGVAGWADGKESAKITLTRCSNNGTVGKAAQKTTSGMGGVVGDASHAEITNCQNNGDIYGFKYTGGVVGIARGKTLLAGCTGTAQAKLTCGNGDRLGGIAGRIMDAAKAKDCVNLSAIKGGYHTYVGGIVGELVGPETSVESCTNGDTNDKTLGNVATSGDHWGGIAGNANAGTIKNCTNYADLKDSKRNHGAGIVGLASNGSVIENCGNRGDLSSSGFVFLGGIVGKQEGNARMANCTNWGNIDGGGAWPELGIGGIVGMCRGTEVNQETVNNCVNYGAVTSSVNDAGGIAGYIAGRTLISKNWNYGAVTSGGQNAGGIVGNLRGNNSVIKESHNFGGIGNSTGQGKLGGIVGSMDNATLTVFSCNNFGTVAHTGRASDVGGIVGEMRRQNEKLINCVNSGLVNAPESRNVGGVAGSSRGEIVSCRNTYMDARPFLHDPAVSFTQTAEGDVHTAGKTSVGGIVGLNTNADSSQLALVRNYIATKDNAYITSELTCNTLPIKAGGGFDNVGGIAGLCAGGSVVGAYNTGEIELGGLLPGHGSVGGAIGKMQANGNNISLVAGAFSFGQIQGVGAGSYYRGAVIGYRTDKDRLPMQQSFFENGVVASTTVENLTGPWAVGNEPYGAEGYKGGAQDTIRVATGTNAGTLDTSMTGPYMTAFKAQHGITGTGVELAEAFIKEFEYKLPAPTITNVDVANALANGSYNVTWEGGQGVLKGYEVTYKVYEKDGDKVISTLANTINNPAQNTVSPIFPKELVGCEFTVSIQAKGVEGSSEDSDISFYDKNGDKTPDRMLILPTMQKPEATCKQLPDSDQVRVKFSLSNPAAYLQDGKPVADYPNLAAWKDVYQSAYDRYLAGLDYIELVVTDSDNQETGKLRFNVTTATSGNVICTDESGREIDPVLTLDMKGLTEKIFTANIKAYPKGGLGLPVNGGYAYFVSEAYSFPVKVVQMQKLKTPVLTALTYTGDLTTPKFTATWNKVDNAESYKVIITDKDGNELYTATTAALTMEWKDIATSDYGKDFSVTVTALPKADSHYVTSDASNEMKGKVPYRQLEPEITYTYMPVENKLQEGYTVAWADGQDQAAKYDYTIVQTNLKDGEKKTEEKGSGHTQWHLDYSDEPILNDSKITASVTELGEMGISLSTTASKEYTVYHRVGRPENLTVDKVETATGTNVSAMRKLTWTAPADATADNCEGYIVYQVVTAGAGGTESEYRLLGETTGRDQTELTVNFEYGVGQIGVVVVAKGKDGVTSNSLKSDEQHFTIDNRLPKPENLSVTPPAPGPDPLSVAAFERAAYTASWTPGGGILQGYDVRVMDGLGNIVARDDNLSASAANWTFSGLSAAYAGQTLTVKLQAKGGGITVDSEVVECTVTMPTVKLDTPALGEYAVATSGVVPGDKAALLWTPVDYAGSYAVSYTYTEPSMVPGQPDSTITVDGGTIPAVPSQADYSAPFPEAVVQAMAGGKTVSASVIAEPAEPMRYVASEAGTRELTGADAPLPPTRSMLGGMEGTPVNPYVYDAGPYAGDPYGGMYEYHGANPYGGGYEGMPYNPYGGGMVAVGARRVHGYGRR